MTGNAVQRAHATHQRRATDRGQLQIRDEQVDWLAPIRGVIEQGFRFGTVGGRQDTPAGTLERPRHPCEHRRIVINDQHRARPGRRHRLLI